MNRFLGIAVVSLGFAAAACAPEGPAERAGANLDEAVENVRDSAAAVGDDLREAGDDIADEVN